MSVAVVGTTIAGFPVEAPVTWGRGRARHPSRRVQDVRPLEARAQQAGKSVRIGVFAGTINPIMGPAFRAFLDELSRAGLWPIKKRKWPIQTRKNCLSRLDLSSSGAICGSPSRRVAPGVMSWQAPRCSGLSCLNALGVGALHSCVRSGSHFGQRYCPQCLRNQIGFGANVRLAAEEFGLRGSSSSAAMRGTPFGQPTLPPGIGGHRIA